MYNIEIPRDTTYIVLFSVTSRGTGSRLSLGGRSHFRRARQNADVLARWQGVHCVGHEMLDISSRRAGTFFVLWNPESRSVQLRASISGSHLAFRSFSLQGVRRWVRETFS